MAKKRKLKNVIKKIKDKANNVPFAVLLPFKPMMQKALADKHYPVPTDLSDLVTSFYNIVVKKKNFNGEYHLAEEVVSGIITAIISFIRSLKKKKESGEELTPDEMNILNTTEKVSDTLVEYGKEEGKTEVGRKISDFIFSWKGGVALLALGGLLFYAFKK